MVSIGTIITTAIGGLIGILLQRLFKKVDKMEEEQNAHHKENALEREADRELVLATSTLTELLARKLSGEGINGQMEDAINEVAEKRDTVQKLTRRAYFEYLEGVKND